MNVLFDFIFADVVGLNQFIAKRPKAIDKLINQHPNTPDIDPVVMLMRPLNHFRREIIESAAVSLPFRVDLFDKVGPTKICQFHNPVSIDQNILRLDVSVNNVLLMDVDQSFDDLLDVLGSLFLRKSSLWAFGHHTTVQLTLLGVLQNKIN